MANPQPNKFTRLSNELYEAIMQSDFTKRQRNILDLVIRMSYGCNKKVAILKKSDFEQVGVRKTHIKAELEYLKAAKVLIIEGDFIQLNKNYDEWRVSIIRGFNPEKYKEILRINLSGEVPEIGTRVTETGTEKEDKKDEELPIQEPDSSQNSNSEVPKTVTATPYKPSQDKAYRAPKDILKTSKDSSKATDDENWMMNDIDPEESQMLKDVVDHWIKKSGRFPSSIDHIEIEKMLLEEKIPAEDIKRGITFAFDRAKKTGQKINSFRYCLGIIRDQYSARCESSKVIPMRPSYQEPARGNVIPENTDDVLAKYEAALKASQERAKRAKG